MYNKDEIDKLTRLLKDSFLEEGLEREIKRAERYRRPLTFLLIDPGVPEDRFHQVGYLALKKIANIARGTTRYLDIKVRYRNRILILLPETDYEGGLRVALKIKNQMDMMSFHDFPDIIPVGNVGVASFPEDGIGKDSIILSLEQDLKVPLEKKTPEGFRQIAGLNKNKTQEKKTPEIAQIDDIDGLMKL
ncbi:MAG: GGDEF domain-containing protein [Candidatus Eremiobacteraeota bacterium]|nr:GGDEF domain-containing protein [Candidatus Eremiobacteraeota bacterium]